MSSRQSSDQIWRLQTLILEAIARGESLAAVGDLICHEAEKLAPSAICSILTIDAQRKVRPLAAPSLPQSYSQAIDGLPVGPTVGSCGTAAYRGEAVEVTDIATDPLWADYKALVIPLGLSACWSSPIKTRDGRVIGTFAFYYRDRRGPSECERRIVDASVHICAIAMEREEERARVHRFAWYDELTGLPNRALCRQETKRILSSRTIDRTISVFYIDLDDFKGVNDTLGHHAGDILLKRVGERLGSLSRTGIFVGRLGGDEFAVVQPDGIGREDAARLAETILSLFERPFDINDNKITIGASIGIAQAPGDGSDLSELAPRSDMALYAAKGEVGERYRFFEPEMEHGLKERRSLKQAFRSAFDNGDLTLSYQPLVALDARRIVAFEALLRWHHPTRGNISPAVFIPLAEEIGLIGPLGDWVMREACRTATEWPADVALSVNLSPLQLAKSGLALSVARILADTRLLPTRLDVEVTETALLDRDSTDVALRELLALNALGVDISLDDFGTGYSSLRYLRSFPFAKIKIDMSFVAEIGRNTDSTAIVAAVIGLASELGMRTTAEGVETEEQCHWLTERGCNEGQGFLFSRPLAKDAIPALLGQDFLAHPFHSRRRGGSAG
jgi:diguanylate cyclase (GGDEF)-like protein